METAAYLHSEGMAWHEPQDARQAWQQAQGDQLRLHPRPAEANSDLAVQRFFHVSVSLKACAIYGRLVGFTDAAS